MQFTLGSILLLATTALGQTVCPNSSIFRVHSVLKNSTDGVNSTHTINTTSSFGYVKSSHMYSARYHATLVPVDPSESDNKAWTLARAYTTDIYNNTDSYLRFPDADYVLSHSLGFTLGALSKETPAAFAEINGADGPNEEVGTVGVYYDDSGKIQYQIPGGKKVHWHGMSSALPDLRDLQLICFAACPNRDVEYESNVTLLGYRLHNATVPRGCYDIDLVIEYMDGWNTPTGLPPKCWDHY